MNIIDFIRKVFGYKKPVYHCLRCNRPLVDEDSVARGYGPDCWKIMRKKIAKPDPIEPDPDPLPSPSYQLDPDTGELMRIHEQE